jgi:NAD(P)H-hydrate epimerase
MGGAMILASTACMRSGVGLCTAMVPYRLEKSLHSSIPDVTLWLDSEEDFISVMPSLSGYDALAIGPGLGTAERTAQVLRKILKNSKIPLVLDADALNLIAQHSWQKDIPQGSILTPHPKEFERLFGKVTASFEA